MPSRISREEAIRRVGSPTGCVPCGWVRRPWPLAESEHAVALLSPYPVRWGHILVPLRPCATKLGEVSSDAFADASRLAHAAGVALERALQPARCYVASLGTAQDDLPMTFSHLHFNVIPVAEPDARPREVLTWSQGVYEASWQEWESLSAQLRSAWPSDR